MDCHKRGGTAICRGHMQLCEAIYLVRLELRVIDGWRRLRGPKNGVSWLQSLLLAIIAGRSGVFAQRDGIAGAQAKKLRKKNRIARFQNHHSIQVKTNQCCNAKLFLLMFIKNYTTGSKTPFSPETYFYFCFVPHF